MSDREHLTRPGDFDDAVGDLSALAIDPRKLLYLATAIEEGSLSKAAKTLGISQPALTKSMNRLEQEFGRRLLMRTANGIVPTALGELIYAHAKLIRDEIGLAKTRLQSETAATDIVTVGTLPSLASRVLPLAVARWRDLAPRVLLRVIERRQVDLLMGVLRREFDFVIAQTEFYDIFPEGLKQRVLFRDRLTVFARPGHCLFERPALTWADLSEFPWVCPMFGSHQRTIFERLLDAENVPPPRQLIESGSIEFTKTLIAESDHLALLAEHSTMTDVREGLIKALPVSFPAIKRSIAVIFRESAPLTDLQRGFVNELECVGKELCGD
ncbi:LysR family transcriptional regulator [Caballeronia sp. LZ008]|uniref:LysR family transcriptional regulator n=1 Tax=unclassified Caballeronia TaxID=2646786 RepID=UPI00202852A8|nr:MULTISPECIES: LysR family transcriptional regulator [unclassified Caballeronia]MDR5798167.1 LysR family transcriptional regulator [Caballeronia sp. LZ008]